MKIRNNKENGFTIIEVVLVLAIAALIFLMVFVAFPGLQRSQRNNSVKAAVGTVVTAVSDYASNNRGVLPDTTPKLEDYVKDLATSGYSIPVKVLAASQDVAFDQKLNTITVYVNANCSGTSNANVASASARQYAVTTILESAGSPVPYCVNG